ncbi:TCP family transcription factor 4 [Actinidia rufa]|uniref:TCP family transcription factor 4 n=1 Tax=Actinidia rufa TaxID=165716 RepID=A0A7J0E2T0_9ERIC|nr:TCP family transcription factor 4 [Actinidia rufa]
MQVAEKTSPFKLSSNSDILWESSPDQSTALLGAVVAEAVLDVIEPGGGVGSKANAAVSQPLGCADIAVAVFLAGGPDNVAALHLHDLAAGVPQTQSRRCLTVVDLGSGFGFGEAEDAVEDGVDVDDGGGDSSEDPDSDCFDFAVPAFD